MDIVPRGSANIETQKSPVCPFCNQRIHNATLVVSGMKNFYLCPVCDKVLSIGEVHE
ncbi:MAG TPA: hypothetical protein VJI12_03350 [archaeon]|nr:hypothetical protein [archaeon]